MTGINEKKTVTTTEEVTTEETTGKAPEAPYVTHEQLEQLVVDFNKALQVRDQQNYMKEDDLTKAFMMINQAVAALNAKTEVVVEKLLDQGTLTREEVDTALTKKLEEAQRLQKEALEKALQAQKEAAELTEKEVSNG